METVTKMEHLRLIPVSDILFAIFALLRRSDLVDLKAKSPKLTHSAWALDVFVL